GKGSDGGGGEGGGGRWVTVCVNGGNASASKPTSFARALAGLRQRYVTDRPQTHLADPALGLVAEQPNFAPAVGDAQHQTISVAVVAGPLKLLHHSRSQPIALSRNHVASFRG